MKLFNVSLQLEVKRILFSRWFVILLIICLISIFGLSEIYKAEDKTLDINVGVVFEKEDEYSENILKRLRKLDVAEFDKLEGYSQKELENMVALGEYETIYFISSSLRSAMANGIVRKSVPSLVSPTSIFSTLLDEWFFSAVLIESTPDISIREIERQLKMKPEDIEKEINEKFRWYEENYNYVTTVSTWEGGILKTAENTRLGWVRAYHGIIALGVLLLQAANLSTLISRLNYVDTGLRKMQKLTFRLSSFLSSIISCLLFSGISLGVLKIFDLAVVRSIRFEFIANFLYILCLSSFIIFLGTVLKTSEGIFSGTVFMFLAVIFLGGVLFNPAEVSPWLDSIGKVFPTYYYSNAIVEVSYMPLVKLAIGSAIFLVAGLLLALLPERKRG